MPVSLVASMPPRLESFVNQKMNGALGDAPEAGGEAFVESADAFLLEDLTAGIRISVVAEPVGAGVELHTRLHHPDGVGERIGYDAGRRRRQDVRARVRLAKHRRERGLAGGVRPKVGGARGQDTYPGGGQAAKESAESLPSRDISRDAHKGGMSSALLHRRYRLQFGLDHLQRAGDGGGESARKAAGQQRRHLSTPVQRTERNGSRTGGSGGAQLTAGRRRRRRPAILSGGVAGLAPAGLVVPR
eukprot:ctg_1304.g409